ncbi:MerR family transcriptional regulator [Myceligenerans salitolerans]|uniref:MerR family transcriptional regulator n=1 Tax=Myceligenerans salitolerans TaxID=1230528 RepID=A0ABS3I433_9MICO|nr:MerR family transcriptional regulator [Myceligenerans salitolerans]MBO0607752.1 MerR family transcriptional regulator [Myceligenerans salitolerans]
MTDTSSTRTYTPAEAASESGFSIDTLRYYEREGLLAPISRTSGGRRTYSEADLGWLGLVRCLRDTGMPIADLKQYAQLCLDASTMDERLSLLQEHDRRVQEQVDLLVGQQERLREKIGWYLANGATPAEQERASARS